MNITFFKEPFEYLIFDNFLNDVQLDNVNSELDFIVNGNYINKVNSKLTDASAIDSKSNEVLAKRHSLFLHDMFIDHRAHSKIYESIFLNFLRNDLHRAFPSCTLMQYLPYTNRDSTLISFYQDGDYYKPHYDISLMTFILYLWKDKDFEGGELLFPDHDIKIDVKNNQAIVFPSCMIHEVSPIRSLNKTNDFYKRVSISTFITTVAT